MSDKETYKERMQAQLNEWKEEAGKLKDKASQEASHISQEAQEAIKEQIKKLEEKIAQGKSKLDELAQATEDAWDSVITQEGAPLFSPCSLCAD